ncbi:MAG TPA: VOC family protein [Propionicimonas sp.]|nr:VOC family protein [Propionicimonas sp.]
MAILNPYLSFRGNAREAMEFYKSVFGGELTISTFGEYQMPGIGADEADQIMHGQLTTPAGFTLMGSDTPEGMPYDDSSGGITVSVSGDDETELRGYWDGLADGGEITMPLEKAPWGDSFGQLNDRYGTPWMFNIAGSSGN